MPMQRSKGSGGEDACRREAEEAEAYELARGVRRSKGRINHQVVWFRGEAMHIVGGKVYGGLGHPIDQMPGPAARKIAKALIG